MGGGLLKIEILRCRNLPQTEDDPNPCTTQVQASIFNREMTLAVTKEVCSSIQEKSNDPFFKDNLEFEVPDNFEEGVILLKIVELSRYEKPTPILYAGERFSLSNTKEKSEFIVPLRKKNPIKNTDLIHDIGHGEVSGGSPFVSLKLHFSKIKSKSTEDPDADLYVDKLPLIGSCQLVPANSQYVWLRLTTDKRWSESFRYALVSAWKSRVLSEEGEADKKLPPINTVGDVVMKRWHCRRGHQILTRVRLSAEKFSKGESNLIFSSSDEKKFRAERKSRTHLVKEMMHDCLRTTGTNAVRDWLLRLWVIFAVGIDNDPNGGKVLSYEVRKNVHEATFDTEDAVTLRAGIFYFFIPTLPFEFCLKIAEEDFRKEPLPPLEKDSNFDSSISKATPSQKLFTTVLVDVLGPLLDTLTEIEIAKILKTFKPAVIDVRDRINKGIKNEIKARLDEEPDDALFYKGDGIHINHLDKYGNRKKQNKFA